MNMESSSSSTVSHKRYRFLAFGLRTGLLLVTLVACLFALNNLRNDREKKLVKIRELKTVLGELVINDYSQFGLSREPVFPGQAHWQVFLPDGRNYELCWDVQPKALPKSSGRLEIAPGYHHLSLNALQSADSWQLVLAEDEHDHTLSSYDGKVNPDELFKHQNDTRVFKPIAPSSLTSSLQQSVSQPLELIRTGVDGEYRIRLWIEANAP